MDAESSYESDLSESWSLIDINLNEESFITTDASPTLEKSHSTNLNNYKTEKINESENFVKKCKELREIDISQISDSDSDSTFKNQNLEICNNIKEVQSYQDLDDECQNDSGDAESIEILEIDGNYQDSEINGFDQSVIGNFNFSTYQSDNEDSSDEEIHNENKSDSSTVIKRKRRKVHRNVDDTVNYLYSKNAWLNDTKKVSEKFSKAKNHPVYKHYRNNVANTVLSLSVGIIFAGVACIAVGHFLGVQDAAETAVELLQMLKKLQMENAALQTSMVHLKKALHTLETNSKVELPLSQPYNTVSCEETIKIIPSNLETQEGLKKTPLPEICSNLNSIDWVSKLQNIVKKGTETENSRMGKHIHDQLNLLKEKEEEVKLSDDVDLSLVLKKLLIVLKKIINRLSSSHDNIEIVRERLTNLKQTINYNFNKIFRDSMKRQEKNKIPTELKLKKLNWDSNCLDNEENLESKDLYKFPQPQKYYELKSKSSNCSLENVDYQNARKNKKKYKGSKSEKNKKKKLEMKSCKKKKEIKCKKKDKKLKRGFENKFEKKKPDYMIYTNNFRLFNESIFSHKKKQKKGVKYKKRFKKVEMSKPKKVLLLKLKKESDKKKKHVPFCSESQCFNLTGYWVFKMADGREEFRRHQTLGDWQFERAKARKVLRNEDFTGYWQFKRALARENNRNDYQASGEKFKKYTGKEFFQERFSWF